MFFFVEKFEGNTFLMLSC